MTLYRTQVATIFVWIVAAASPALGRSPVVDFTVENNDSGTSRMWVKAHSAKEWQLFKRVAPHREAVFTLRGNGGFDVLICRSDDTFLSIDNANITSLASGTYSFAAKEGRIIHEHGKEKLVFEEKASCPTKEGSTACQPVAVVKTEASKVTLSNIRAHCGKASKDLEGPTPPEPGGSDDKDDPKDDDKKQHHANNA